MTKDEALKLSLEALEKSHTCPLLPDDCAEAITAIKEALMSVPDGAQPQPWEKFCDSSCVWTDHHPDCKLAEQEPVAKQKLIGWRTENFLWETADIKKAQNWEPNIGVLPIFEGDPNTQLTTPPPVAEPHKRPSRSDIKPLTDEEINEFFQGMEPNNGFWLSFARAIEAAHGIYAPEERKGKHG